MSKGLTKLYSLDTVQISESPHVSKPKNVLPPLWISSLLSYAAPKTLTMPIDALFGFVRTHQELDDVQPPGNAIPKQGDKARAYASRVCVTDATLREEQTDIWLSQEPIVPKILATPKPTAFQHYLVQPSHRKQTLKHYDSASPQDTVIRGHKRYWHQDLSDGKALSLDQIRDVIEEEKSQLKAMTEREERGSSDTQHTRFKPVKPGVQFTFRVYFENLSEHELGALCWVLHPLGDPDQDYCHHLGMGKPLGMGGVSLEASLYLTDRTRRYTSLFEGKTWQTGGSDSAYVLSERSTLEQLTAKFEQNVLRTLKLHESYSHLSHIKRIGIFLKMLEWPGYRRGVFPSSDNLFLTRRNRPNTRYMTIQPENEYRDRHILPKPSAFGVLTGYAEPASRTEESSGTRATSVSPSNLPTPDPPVPPEPKMKTFRRGDRVQVEVMAKEGNTFTLRVLDTGQDDLQLTARHLNWQVGERFRARVVEVRGDGRIRKVVR